MRNIFKTFKENERLSEENKILKAQYESLMDFKKSFDNYYHKLSDIKVIEKTYDNKMVVTGVCTFDLEGMHTPVDMCKERVAREITRKIMPFIEFDVVDNRAYGTKDLVGRVFVVTK